MTSETQSPAHYQLCGLGIEVIDVIQASMSPDEFEAHCQGTAQAYVLRARHKGSFHKDMLKAAHYCLWAAGFDPREVLRLGEAVNGEP